MYTINIYFNENSEQIKQRFKEASVNDLKIGAIINHELKKFIENMNVTLSTEHYFEYIQLRASFCKKLLERYYDADETECKTRLKILHRGTAYYFIALGRFLNHDYQGFAYYMDMAVVQDNKNMYYEHRTEGSAAEKTFLGFTHYPDKFWLDNKINKCIFSQIEKMFNLYKRNSPESSYEISDFKDRFVVKTLRDNENPYHSNISSFYSWVLESQYLLQLLYISPPEHGYNGSMEPFYLHLAKGALILESIGKMVIHRKTGIICNGQLGNVLNEYLNFDMFGHQTKINQYFEGSRIETLDEVLNYVATHSSFDKVTAYKIALTIRNTTSHSLNWNAASDFAKTQEDLYSIIVRALFSMIELMP